MQAIISTKYLGHILDEIEYIIIREARAGKDMKRSPIQFYFGGSLLVKSPLLIFFSILMLACSTSTQKIEDGRQYSDSELLRFAEASCFYWYFKKKGYELQDIRAISGGIVELGSHSFEKYQEVSLLVKAYKPPIATKQEIDIDLLKCFRLRGDIEFIESLGK